MSKVKDTLINQQQKAIQKYEKALQKDRAAMLKAYQAMQANKCATAQFLLQAHMQSVGVSIDG